MGLSLPLRGDSVAIHRPNVLTYGWMYDHLAAAENLVLAVGFAMLMNRSKGKWREVYAHLFSASLLYAAGSYITNRAIDRQDYFTGSVFDLPLVASFIWFGTAGFVAYSMKPQREAVPAAGRGLHEIGPSCCPGQPSSRFL